MIEKEINELIVQMENRGFDYTHDNKDGVYFDFNDGTAGYICLSDWDEVESYCRNHEQNEEE